MVAAARFGSDLELTGTALLDAEFRRQAAVVAVDLGLNVEQLAAEIADGRRRRQSHRDAGADRNRRADQASADRVPRGRSGWRGLPEALNEPNMSTTTHTQEVGVGKPTFVRTQPGVHPTTAELELSGFANTHWAGANSLPRPFPCT